MGARYPPDGRRTTLAATLGPPNLGNGPGPASVPGVGRAYPGPRMMRTGILAALLGLALTVAGCGSGSGSPIASSSVPPDDLPACSSIYKAGAKVEDATFGLACVKNGQVLSP